MFANRSRRTVVLGIEKTIYTLKKYAAREMVIIYDNVQVHDANIN